MQAAGDVVRPGAKDNPNWPEKLYARTYTLNTARKRLNVSRYSMDQAVATGLLPIFADPNGDTRISAAVVEDILAAERDDSDGLPVRATMLAIMVILTKCDGESNDVWRQTAKKPWRGARA